MYRSSSEIFAATPRDITLAIMRLAGLLRAMHVHTQRGHFTARRRLRVRAYLLYRFIRAAGVAPSDIDSLWQVPDVPF